jgi:hypothetical protein
MWVVTVRLDICLGALGESFAFWPETPCAHLDVHEWFVIRMLIPPSLFDYMRLLHFSAVTIPSPGYQLYFTQYMETWSYQVA